MTFEADTAPTPMPTGFMSPDDGTDAMPAPLESALAPQPPGGIPPEHQLIIRWSSPDYRGNIAEELTPEAVATIGFQVVEEAEIDDKSRSEWLKQGEIAMDLALQRAKGKSDPWPGCSNVVYPLMTEAADQFAARAYPGIVQNRNVVKGSVYGQDNGVPAKDPMTGQPATGPDGKPAYMIPPGAKAARAEKIGEHMSWQLLEEQTEWESDMDIMLHVLPIIGCEFKKTYFDPVEGRNMSVRVAAKNLIVNYWAKSLETAPRKTEIIELYPYEVEQHRRSGFFIDQDYGAPDPDNKKGDSIDKDAPLIFYEQHRRLDLDHDGYAEPYIVVVHKMSLRVARISACYDADGIKANLDGQVTKINAVEYYTKYDFLPNKEGGIYGIGFGQVLLGMNEATSSVLNQLIDAGTLATTQGGFVGKGLSMQSGALKFKRGEWKVINAAGGAIRDAIVPLQFKEPSPVLYNLLVFLVGAGKDISSVKDVLSGDVKAQTMSPTVFLAMVEQGLKVFTAIYKRIHRALKREFDKLYRLNRIYLDEEASYKVGDLWKGITRQDYLEGAGVEPVSDPAMVADAQRMARANVLAEFKDDPMFDGLEIRRRILEAASIDNPDKLLTGKPAPNPETLARVAELHLKAIETRARAVLNLAQAVKFLADAESTHVQDFQTWASIEIQQMQQQMDALNGSGSANDTPGGSGTDGGGNPTAPPPSGLARPQGLPAGLPGLNPPGAPGAMGGRSGAIPG